MNIDLGLGDVLRAISEVVLQSRDRIQASRAAKWDQLLSALQLLEDITALHVRAVVHVCDPVLERGDVIATAREYQRLVDNPDFPIGYGLVKGILEPAYGMSEFKKPGVHEVIGVLLSQVHDFQTAGFMLGLGSGVAADSLNVLAELHGVNQHVEHSDTENLEDHERLGLLRAQAKERLDAMFDWLAMQPGQEPSLGRPEPRTAVDVVRLTQLWARHWKAHVQTTLYGGRGLHNSIGQLRMAAGNASVQ
jgi:hypothetical protein